MLFGRKKKNPIKLPDKGVVDWKYATCGYCSTGCSIEVGINKKDPSFRDGINSFPVFFHTAIPKTTMMLGILKKSNLLAIKTEVLQKQKKEYPIGWIL